MNLILVGEEETQPVKPEECKEADTEEEGKKSDYLRCVILAASDERTLHLATVLRVSDGNSVRVGVIDGGLFDSAQVRWHSPEFSALLASRRQSGRRLTKSEITKKKKKKTGESSEDSQSISSVQLTWDVRTSRDSHSVNPSIHLIMAVPRPKVLGRLWSTLAELGVARITLTGANKVERSYFDSNELQSSRVRKQLIRGLSQSAVDTRLPSVDVIRSFDRCLARLKKAFKERTSLCAIHGCQTPLRLLAHCGKHPSVSNRLRDWQITREMKPKHSSMTVECSSSVSSADADGGSAMDKSEICCSCAIQIAVGPEGGWLDEEVVPLMNDCGFLACSMGSRILRTETAVPVLVGLASALCE